MFYEVAGSDERQDVGARGVTWAHRATPEATVAWASLTDNPAVSIVAKEGGTIEIAVTRRLAPELEAAITYAIPEPARLGFAEAAEM